MDNESKNSHSGNQIGTVHSKWLSENVEGQHQKCVNQIVKRMLEIIENVEDSSAEKMKIYFQKHPELISLIEEMNHKHQFLAEQYDHLAEEVCANVSSPIQMQKTGSAIFHTCLDNRFLTPDQKLGMHKIERQAIAFDLPLSSGGSSSNISAKEGSESSLSLSSESDSESYKPSTCSHSNSTMNSGEMLNKVETTDDILKVTENPEYGELMILKQKLRFSDDEITRMKSELEIRSGAMDSLKAETERAIYEVKIHEDDLELERRKVSELQMQIAVLETKVVDSGCKIETLVKELKSTKEKLDISEGELAKSKQDILNEVSDRDCEIRKLTSALQEALRNSEVEKAQFQSHNSSLLEKVTLLETRCAEHEVHIKSLENEIKRYQISKMEMEAIYDAQEIILCGDIDGLKAELHEKDAQVESLNKNCDGLKLRYDMLMAEKDGLIAKVHTLHAELCSRDIRIQQLEAELHQLKLQHTEITTISEREFKLRDELRMKVEGLEKEVESQAAIISERAEEKREAIRQLCLSLEHYRSGYQELREAYIGQKRQPVMAS